MMEHGTAGQDGRPAAGAKRWTPWRVYRQLTGQKFAYFMAAVNVPTRGY